MSKTNARPPRLFVFVWFIAAAGVLAGGFLLQAMGYSEALGLEHGLEMTLIYVLCAFFVGQGVGEWRGLRYAKHVRESVGSA